MKFEKKVFLLIFLLLILSIEIFFIAGCASDDRGTDQVNFIPNKKPPLQYLRAPDIKTIKNKVVNYETVGVTLEWYRIRDRKWVNDEQPETFLIKFYKIFRNNTEIYKTPDLLDTTSTLLTFDDDTIKTKGTYYYEIGAEGDKGEKSARSFPVSIAITSDIK